MWFLREIFPEQFDAHNIIKIVCGDGYKVDNRLFSRRESFLPYLDTGKGVSTTFFNVA